MRTIDTSAVVPIIRKLFMDACVNVEPGFLAALADAAKREESPLGREILDTLLANAALAKREQIACCQDTGAAIVYLQIGQEVCWSGAPLEDAVNEGVRQAYKDGYLRKSMLADPILRVNTGDNTPAVIHAEIVPGDKVHISALPKGGGSENMSRYTMLTPDLGAEGVKRFVLETVELAGGKPCPPLLIGVGIGGTMDNVTWISKKALLRPIGERSKQAHLAKLEEELLEAVNDTGVGPLGLGGRVTAIDVHVETYACHITSLPVSVSIQCHASRHTTAAL